LGNAIPWIGWSHREDVKNLGDEAAIIRSSIVSGVNFRRGAFLIKIGVHPPVPDDGALKAAASAALSRL
jgi:hypothetical protein